LKVVLDTAIGSEAHSNSMTGMVNSLYEDAWTTELPSNKPITIDELRLEYSS
jgi:hypothetical protein